MGIQPCNSNAAQLRQIRFECKRKENQKILDSNYEKYEKYTKDRKDSKDSIVSSQQLPSYEEFQAQDPVKRIEERDKEHEILKKDIANNIANRGKINLNEIEATKRAICMNEREQRHKQDQLIQEQNRDKKFVTSVAAGIGIGALAARGLGVNEAVGAVIGSTVGAAVGAIPEEVTQTVISSTKRVTKRVMNAVGCTIM